MKAQLQLNADGRRWDVVRGTEIRTFETIKEAFMVKVELSGRKQTSDRKYRRTLERQAYGR